MQIADITFGIAQEAQDQLLPTAENYIESDGGFGSFISATLAAILTVAALMVLLYMVWGAIEWITAGGDKGKTEKARDKMTQSMIGIIILVSVLAIYGVLLQFLGITSIELPSYKQVKTIDTNTDGNHGGNNPLQPGPAADGDGDNNKSP
jgi:hypothetical protein